MSHPLGLQINPGSKKEKQKEKEPRSWSDPCLACLGHRNALRFSCLPGRFLLQLGFVWRAVPGFLVEFVKSGLNTELVAGAAAGRVFCRARRCQRWARGAWRRQRWQTTSGEAFWACNGLFCPFRAVPGRREMSPGGEGAAWGQRQPGDALGSASSSLLSSGHGVSGPPFGPRLSSGFEPHGCQPGLSPPCPR